MGPDPQDRLDEFLRRPRRAVWVLALPMMASFTMHALYSIVDHIFIGRLGPMALAASTFVGPLFFMALAVGIGFATGVTANVAQAVGRRDNEAADRLASSSLGIGLAIGLGFAVSGLLAGERIIPLLGARGESAELAWQYFQILCLGMPLMFLSMAIRSVLTGEGNAKTPMFVMAASTAINIALDPLFIFVFDLGIRGAGLATVTAQIFTLSAFAYIAFVRKRLLVRFRLRLLVPRLETIGPIARIGLPTAAGQFVMAVGAGLLNRVLAAFGQISVAGYGAGSKVDLLVGLPIIGLASATVSVIGMFAGAGRTDLVRSTAIYTYRWVMLLTVVIGVAAYLSSTWVVGAFTDDPRVLEVGATYLAYMVFAYPLMGFGMTSGRLLQGLGYGVPSLIITLVRVLVVGVPGAYLAVYLFDAPIQAVWVSLIAGGVVANVISVIWVRKVIWKSDPTALASRGTPTQ